MGVSAQEMGMVSNNDNVKRTWRPVAGLGGMEVAPPPREKGRAEAQRSVWAGLVRLGDGVRTYFLGV